MCANPTQYSGSASSPVSGCCDPGDMMAGCCTPGVDCCGTPGPACAAVDWAAADCDSAGYWTCDGVADVYATSMGTTGWADCSTTIPSGSTSTWAETTFVARAYSRARAPGTDSATCSLTPRSQENAGIHLLRWGGLRLRR